MESKYYMKKISDSSYKLGATYGEEIDRAIRISNLKDKTPISTPLETYTPDLPAHIEMFSEFLQTTDQPPTVDEILPDKLLENKLAIIKNDSNLKSHFPAGHKIILAILPFSENGNPLTEDEIHDGGHLKRLIMSSDKGNAHVKNGFSQFPNFINRIIPAELKVAFTVEDYENNDPYDITPTDRKQIMDKYTTAFRQLKATLNKYWNN